MRAEVQVLPGPPPASDQRKRWSSCLELVGQSACWIKNSYLITVLGHEPDVRAYSSWSSNGIVAIDDSDPTQPERVGQFVPDTSRRHANSLGVGSAEVSGVAIDPETGIVYASDMRRPLDRPAERAGAVVISLRQANGVIHEAAAYRVVG